MPVFDFTDASIKGDLRWSTASTFTSYAPPVVLFLALLSMAEIVIGVVWITSIQSLATDLSFGQVIQPIVVPGLSFFNTIPSLHLHVLARSNKPLMALIFSSVMGGIYLASAVVFLPPCTGVGAWGKHNNGNGGGGYRNAECPSGGNRRVWAVMVALQFLSAAGYGVHAAMAWYVRRVTSKRDRDVREGRVVVVEDEDAKAKREEEARRRWRDIVDL